MFCKCRVLCETVLRHCVCQLVCLTNCMYHFAILDTNIINSFLYHTLVYSLIVLFWLFLLYQS